MIAPLRNEEHTVHACEHRLCSVSCQLCKRLCRGVHLHGLDPNQNHLCGWVCLISFTDIIYFQLYRQEHSCSALCSAPGICQIDTTPHSIEATFTGRHETFQYTKVCLLLLTLEANVLIIRLVHARYVPGGPALLSYKYIALDAKRLRCVKIIEPGEVEHLGSHIHSIEKQPFHYCETR